VPVCRTDSGMEAVIVAVMTGGLAWWFLRRQLGVW
jgi:hypothetical protein